jgi:predicted DNA binding CopG/RHH family protein
MNIRDNKQSKSIVRSIRFSPTLLELIKQEAALRKTPFSEFVRQSILANLKYTRRQAIEAWGR